MSQLTGIRVNSLLRLLISAFFLLLFISCANNPDTISAVTPTALSLYQTDFSQGSQEWLDNSPSSQWTYNNQTKVLESDGSTPCCNPETLPHILIQAPYSLKIHDYAVEARIKVLGTNHPPIDEQTAFFGFYIRGTALNQQGYMIGIIENPSGKPGGKPHSYLVAMGTNLPDNRIYYEGGEYTKLDQEWHIYRAETRGDTFKLFRDNKQTNSISLLDNHFSFGPQIGIEDYNYHLQIQTIRVSPL